MDHISSVRNTISHRGRWALGINFSDFPVVAPLCIMLQQANNIRKHYKQYEKYKKKNQTKDPKIARFFSLTQKNWFFSAGNSNYTAWTSLILNYWLFEYNAIKSMQHIYNQWRRNYNTDATRMLIGWLSVWVFFLFISSQQLYIFITPINLLVAPPTSHMVWKIDFYQTYFGHPRSSQWWLNIDFIISWHHHWMHHWLYCTTDLYDKVYFLLLWETKYPCTASENIYLPILPQKP